MPFSGELAWLPKEMRPVAELCPESTRTCSCAA